MAKPSYFYGIHAIDALLEHRPLDALSLFVQQGRESDSHVQAIIATAKDNGVSIQPTQKDKLTQLCGSPQHQGVVMHARPLAFADDGVLDNGMAQENQSNIRIENEHLAGGKTVVVETATPLDNIIVTLGGTSDGTPFTLKFKAEINGKVENEISEQVSGATFSKQFTYAN